MLGQSGTPVRYEEAIVSLLSIGEFARMSQLSPKALRLYGELGLLPPARIDPDSGYRFYAIEQLERARLVSSLRAIGVPLARIGAILDAPPGEAGAQVAAFWAGVEADHTVRRELARRLVERLDGTRSAMYEVATLGKEFVGLLQARPVPRVEGRVGAAFQIYHGAVSDDSDGPVEWCRPVPAEQADALASRFPELVLRVEPAHEEAFVPLGTAELSSAEWQLVSDTLRAWAGGNDDREPSDLGVRVTYLASPQPRAPESRPDCDFAVPLRARA